MVSLAGYVAETRYLSGYFPSGGYASDDAEDLQHVRQMLGEEVHPGGHNFSIAFYCMFTQRVLRDNRTWGSVEALAELLVPCNFVPGEVVTDLFRERKVPRIPRWHLVGTKKSQFIE
jgi:hypothetical protein